MNCRLTVGIALSSLACLLLQGQEPAHEAAKRLHSQLIAETMDTIRKMDTQDVSRVHAAFTPIKTEFDAVMGSVAEGHRSTILQPAEGKPMIASTPENYRKAKKSLHIGDEFGFKEMIASRQVRNVEPGTAVLVIEKDDDATTLYYRIWNRMATKFAIYSLCRRTGLLTEPACAAPDEAKIVERFAPGGSNIAFQRALATFWRKNRFLEKCGHSECGCR